MRDLSRVSKGREVGFVAALVNAVREAVAGEEIGDLEGRLWGELAVRFGVRPLVISGLLRGVEAMAEYGLSALDGVSDALAEEDLALEASRQAFAPLLEARLQARIDAVDGEKAGEAICPKCGERGLSKGRTARTITGVFGDMVLTRRWDRCGKHKGGWSVAEEQLHIPSGKFTARLSEAVTLIATVTSHGSAEKLCHQLLGIEISEHAIQNAVEERAEVVVRLQDQAAERLRPVEKNGRVRVVERPKDAVPSPPDIAYIEVDGVVPMTRELDPERSEPVTGHRGGKGRRYIMEGREVKNAVLYRGDHCCTEGDGRGVVLEKQYVSHLGNWLPFAALLWARVVRLRFDEAKTLILLSDGAHWIRELAKYFPVSVILILDLFHAKHRIWEVANALYGDRTAKARKWAKEQCTRVEAGQTAKVIASLKRLAPKRQAARKLVDELVVYFQNNQDRMDYPSYRAQGWRVSSGGIESANYHVTGARLKMQGMRWSEKGAAEMARLRADYANHEWRHRTREVLAAA